MQPDSSRVEDYFQRTAVEFDGLYERKSAVQYWTNRLLRRALFERLRLTLDAFEGARDFTVLDVGSGSGRNSLMMAQAGARHVLGIDFADNMVDLARAWVKKDPAGARCEFVRGDIFEYSFEQKFDFVAALGVFDYVSDPVRLLRRMMDLSTRKVLGSFPAPSLVRAPLRKLRYSLKNCPVYFYNRRHIEQVCREAGLTDYQILPCTSAGTMLVGKVAAAQAAKRP